MKSVNESQSCKGTDILYLKQLPAEEKRMHPKTKVFRYVRIRRNNHLPDCEVYADACVDCEWLPSLAEVLYGHGRCDRGKATRARTEGAPGTSLVAGSKMSNDRNDNRPISHKVLCGIDEISWYIRCSRDTFYKLLICSLPVWQVGGATWMSHTDNLDAFMADITGKASPIKIDQQQAILMQEKEKQEQ